MFLKDAPLWHEDWHKEIPTNRVMIVVDDAHRAENVATVIRRCSRSFVVSRA